MVANNIALRPSSPLKIWPSLVIAGFKANRGGAVRVWFLARMLDCHGQGWVEFKDLRNHVSDLGVKSRTLYRWIIGALNLGLFRNVENRFYLLGLGRAAVVLGCKNIGNPAEIAAHAFVNTGWRSHVWAAYLTTLNERLASQGVKQRITGVNVRTQGRYQSGELGWARQNYAVLGNGTNKHADGLKEVLGFAVFEYKGKLIQRLPDIRVVRSTVARSLRRGRTRKAQKFINSSFLGRDQLGDTTRLFYALPESARGATRNFANQNLLPDQICDHFALQKVKENHNLWEVIR